jgi:hypothetical protein
MQFAHQGGGEQDRYTTAEQASLDERDLLAPLLAGARARGVADTFELLGIPVIFLGRAGEVLHVGATARPYLGEDLEVISGHLVGSTPAANRALQSLVNAVVAGGEGANSSALLPRHGNEPIRVRAMAFGGADADEMQLLKVVIAFDAPTPASCVDLERSAA